ncbi:hypothetical protein A8713_01035 [Streptomyces sp. SAT1]|uniref:hypothetical protein n=1 Tax=Streptomyces sp. SAT1 TaxID=1849967 RepID=UPI0007DCFAB7|nr:hypothetical protein [Streptomyces sp. SAT1]ANH89892.1 hypothetical protein A8713_01035 [Streptomyces sp. SAT1]
MRSATTSTALVTAVLSLGLAAGGASAAPAARVSPTTVAAGGTVTIQVSCDTGTAPAVAATSQAFADGTVTLRRTQGTVYTGTAAIAPAGNFTSGGPDPVGRLSEWSVDGACPDGGRFRAGFTVDRGR